MMADTPIRIYSINMDSAYNSFMKEIARMSGGFLDVTQEDNNLDKFFSHIVNELRHVYEITYYSPVAEGNRKIDVKTRKGNTRWLNLN